jgi:hypothetical protein
MGHFPKSNLLRLLLAPLLVLSIGLHALLLVAPLPSSPEPDAESEEPEVTEEEDEVVDLLSISSLATPEAELPPEPIPAEVPQEPAPQPAAPPAPTQPVVPETFPEELPPEPPPGDPPPEEFAQDESLQVEPEPQVGFDPNRQAQLANNAVSGIGRAPGESVFDLTDQFTAANLDIPDNRPLWPPEKRACFFSSIDANGFRPAAGAMDIRFLARNIELVRDHDIPRTFSQQTVAPLGPTYCNEELFEVIDADGTPILWFSLVPVSPGGSTTLFVMWQQDPRGG